MAVFANDSPNETLSPNNQFCGVMLFAHLRYQRADQCWVYVYRLLPLYWEEIELINREDVGALLNRFDSQSVGFAVDLHRKNVGL